MRIDLQNAEFSVFLSYRPKIPERRAVITSKKPY
jgi:hypothetical protein